MNNQPYRHGDITFKPVGLPKGAKQVHKKGDYVVALGEHTGHKHVLKNTIAPKFMVFEFNDERYLHVTKPTQLVHEEHHTITIEPGTYRIDHEREFDYVLKQVERVVD